jgi:hypothetical protein
MGILHKINLKMYQDTWQEVSREQFDAEDIASIESAEVVPSQWGLSVKITWKSGDVSYLPISQMVEEPVIGQQVDLTKCFLVTLRRGAKTCEKIYF